MVVELNFIFDGSRPSNMPNDRAFMAISPQAPCIAVLSGSLRVICLYSNAQSLVSIEALYG
jgi:hypothetical protein